MPALKFAKNDIGDAGAAAVAALLKNNSRFVCIVSICFSFSLIFPPCLLSVLHVDLSSNSLTDAGVAVLCEVLKSNTSVLTVDISRNQLTPAAVESIHSLLKVGFLRFLFFFFSQFLFDRPTKSFARSTLAKTQLQKDRRLPQCSRIPPLLFLHWPFPAFSKIRRERKKE